MESFRAAWSDHMRTLTFALFVGLAASGTLAGAAFGQTGSPGPVGAQIQPIGKVESASGTVSITHTDGVLLQANVDPSAGPGQAKAGDPVYRGDVVQTGADSAVRMVFTDGTAFNLSANARIEMNEFVYDPKGTSNSAFISLAKGTFTFIAGKVAQTGDMKVDTPVATMGIRGTAPHVEISDDGTVHFATLVEDESAATPQRKKPGSPGQENKRATPTPQNKGGTPADQRQRQAQNAQSTAADQAMAEQNKKLKGLSICRGC
jgi:hypothetical protein